MEKYLKGVPGKILSEVDAQGRQMPNYENKRIDPQDGLNVVLTIDENIQYFAEEALQKAIEDNKVANGAFAIVMDPRNGEILALVSKPDFNLNDPEPARRQKILPHGPGLHRRMWKPCTGQYGETRRFRIPMNRVPLLRQ